METSAKLRFIDNRWIDILASDDNMNRIYHIIKDDPKAAEKLICKKNFVGVVTNGSSVMDMAFIGGTAT